MISRPVRALIIYLIFVTLTSLSSLEAGIVWWELLGTHLFFLSAMLLLALKKAMITFLFDSVVEFIHKVFSRKN